MTFHVKSGILSDSNLHVPVNQPEFQKTLADLRVKAYKEDKDNSIRNQSLIKELENEKESLKQENMELKKENEKLEAKIKRLSKQI